jgi:hypothetical protein
MLSVSVPEVFGSRGICAFPKLYIQRSTVVSEHMQRLRSNQPGHTRQLPKTFILDKI